MKTIVKENTWLNGISHGWGNGYALIPKGHPMHGKDYDLIDVDVHGGLTFMSLAKECTEWYEISEEDKECWIVGFDTCHGGDTAARWTKDAVMEETEKLAEQLESLS